MVSISREVLREELSLAQRVLTKWMTRLDEGIPQVDIPATEEAFDSFLRELCGELLVVSGKLENLSSILTEDRGGP